MKEEKNKFLVKEKKKKKKYYLMLPLSLLKAAQGKDVELDLKNGEKFRGKLGKCDNWMNVELLDALKINELGDAVARVGRILVRGNFVKLFNFPDELIDSVKDDVVLPPRNKSYTYKSDGSSGSRGRGSRGSRGGRGSHSDRGSGRGRGRGGRGASKDSSSRGRGRGNNDRQRRDSKQKVNKSK
jgi:U6 snRNA-associated Sm-like protein LSm4